jgi:hypothetical protein
VTAILSDYDQKVVRRMAVTILQSPQGRDLGRYFLVERGKGDEGDLGAVKREIFEVLSEEIDCLYASTPPVQSKG